VIYAPDGSFVKFGRCVKILVKEGDHVSVQREVADLVEGCVSEYNLVTQFETLVYYDHNLNSLRSGRLAEVGRNLLLRLVSSRTAHLIERDGDHEQVIERELSVVGDLPKVSIRLNNRYLTATPSGSVSFDARERLSWELFDLVPEGRLDEFYWAPSHPVGGTELQLQSLKAHVGDALSQINLHLNIFSDKKLGDKPNVVWIHNEVGAAYEWMKDIDVLNRVSAFVFVSNWQRQTFVDFYSLVPQKCFVVRNALENLDKFKCRTTEDRWITRCAYTSAPNRGLSILLDAWRILRPLRSELHIWSSARLWGRSRDDDLRAKETIARAKNSDGVFFHGIAPNTVIRQALTDMDILVYPCTFRETSYIAVLEAMAAGCRIICPTFAALPETTAGFARTYPFVAEREQHLKLFLEVLDDEIHNQQRRKTFDSEAQQNYVKSLYSWTNRTHEWSGLISRLCSSPNTRGRRV
jgi:glycosyltransferase involved in cell wall biosynthesis